MLNSSKRNRLARVDAFMVQRGAEQAKGPGTVEREDLQALIAAQQASIDHLVAMRAEPEAKRIAMCSPREAGLRIFGDMALDLQIIEERRRLREWREEVKRAAAHR